MELSISEAGKLCRVHRNTLHEWIQKGWIQQNKKTGLVDTTQIAERLQNRGRRNGRVAGWAYENVDLSKNADIAPTLERGVVILSDIFRPLSPRQQDWIKRTILSRIGDPNLLQQKAVPAGTSEKTTKKSPKETKQERAWNDIMVRGTLNPKTHFYSPAIRAWGKKMKRVMLLEEAEMEVSKEMIMELDSIIEPTKAHPADTPRVPPDLAIPNGK